MTHTGGFWSERVRMRAWDAFLAGPEVAKAQGLYGAGQDLLKDSFSGNVKGMGPAVAELEFEERPNEAFLLFAADKTDPGAYNLPCYLAFADPMVNSGLILSPKIGHGYSFRIMDVEHTEGDRVIDLNAPEDLYDIAALLRDQERFVVESIPSRRTGAIAGARRKNPGPSFFRGPPDRLLPGLLRQERQAHRARGSLRPPVLGVCADQGVGQERRPAPPGILRPRHAPVQRARVRRDRGTDEEDGFPLPRPDAAGGSEGMREGGGGRPPRPRVRQEGEDMAGGIDFRFDFSLVHEGNLRNGEGLTPLTMSRALGRAQRAANKLASRHAAGGIGVPRPPVLQI